MAIAAQGPFPKQIIVFSYDNFYAHSMQDLSMLARVLPILTGNNYNACTKSLLLFDYNLILSFLSEIHIDIIIKAATEEVKDLVAATATSLPQFK